MRSTLERRRVVSEHATSFVLRADPGLAEPDARSNAHGQRPAPVDLRFRARAVTPSLHERRDNVAVFSVIISEKGGAERRETFDRAEINVGRVQGNDLMLPKGNVSKRHARLLFRDGRFIVTDLKSTNGTYVNGRKIAQATIVREGDKIYIGDFVVRIEPGAGPSHVSAAPAIEDAPMANPVSSIPPGPGARQVQPDTSANLPTAAVLLGHAQPSNAALTPFAPPAMPTAPPPLPSAHVAAPPLEVKSSSIPAEPPSSSEPSSAEKALRPPSPRIEPKTGDRHEVISHFPLEHDPDESVHFAVPGPPRVPSSPRGALGGKTLPVPQGPVPAGRTTPPVQGLLPPGPSSPSAPPPLDRPTSPSVSIAAMLGESSKPPPIPVPRRPMPSTLDVDPARARALAAQAPATVAAATTPPDRPSAEPGRGAAHRGALLAIVDRVAELVDLTPLADGAPATDALVDRVERALADAAASTRGQGDLDVDALVIDARREVLELGPLTPLFDDEDVTEIQIVRHDYVVAMHGARQIPSDVGFTSEQAVARVIRRLCFATGKQLRADEPFVERRVARGARLFAVMPRAEDSGHMVVIRKPQRADLSLEDLVRSGTISRAMAGLFAQCVAARANILVTGADGAGATTLLGALAGAGSTEDRVMVLQEDDELVFNQPHTVSILLGDTPEEGARAVRAAARVRPDRLVVGAFAGSVAAELVDAMGDGVDGVLAGARAPTLRQALPRITADIAATKPGVLPEVAREWLASVFDLVIEVARLRDGRHRVLRVAELAVEGNRITARDIFAFNIERTAAGGAIEGTFAPTGVVPGIIEDLAARGVAVDPSIFRRHGKNDSIVSTPAR